MVRINENYLKLQGSYLFSEIAQRVRAFEKAHPDREIIRLGIGDVTEPLAPAVIEAMQKAVSEMGRAETFRGYAPEAGYDFLRQAIAENDFSARGADISPDEVFISDGAKSDSGSIGEIFGSDCRVAICDPVYPVYLDANVMAGRAGEYIKEEGRYSRIIYMPCSEENGFVPDFPGESPDLIYLCFPNNPTGAAVKKEQLQAFVDYALKVGAVIIFDAAYEAYITEEGVPHSIYECEGAKACAIEIRSFSKNAGFTGTRLGASIVPKELIIEGTSLNQLWSRRQGTRFNGVPYIVQRAGEAVYSAEGKAQTRAQVSDYLKNASLIRRELTDAGYTLYGGVNAPYIWLKTPGNLSSWDFFDLLLEKAGVVGTPGSGFGPCGEHFLRLTAFGSAENTKRALERIKDL